MPTLSRKRVRVSQQTRREPSPSVEEEEEEEEEEVEEEATPPPVQSRRPQPRHSFPSQNHAEDEATLRARRRRLNESNEDDDVEPEGDEAEEGTSERKPVTRLVRMALAFEHQRKPIRRSDITEKALGPQFKNEFKQVFADAQKILKNIFGMELVELPVNKEKITLNQQRKAAASQIIKLKQTAAPSANKAWILTSILPPAYRSVAYPYHPDDQAFAGISTMITTLVYLNQRTLGEKTLARYLRRLKASDAIQWEGPKEEGTIDKILQNMVRYGQLVKVKDDTAAGDAQTFSYKIGPRAKLELGKEGVTSFVKDIYGDVAADNIDKAIGRSIGIDRDDLMTNDRDKADEDGDEAPAPAKGAKQVKKQPARKPKGKGRKADSDEEEEDDDDDNE